MDEIMKNIDKGTVLSLKDQVDYLKGQIVSRTLSQNAYQSLTLFAFDGGEQISTHASDGDAMVIALDGAGEITIGTKRHLLQAGETIVMPAKEPHAVYAKEQFKMLLIVIF